MPTRRTPNLSATNLFRRRPRLCERVWGGSWSNAESFSDCMPSGMGSRSRAHACPQLMRVGLQAPACAVVRRPCAYRRAAVNMDSDQWERLATSTFDASLSKLESLAAPDLDHGVRSERGHCRARAAEALGLSADTFFCSWASAWGRAGRAVGLTCCRLGCRRKACVVQGHSGMLWEGSATVAPASPAGCSISVLDVCMASRP